MIVDGFLKSNSKKKLIIVGDVPYNDSYSENIKKLASDRIIFSGYVNSQENLSDLYKNCSAYIHGHEYGGTNPTLINALDLNCNIIALDTVFNNEMLENKKSYLFKKKSKSIAHAIDKFEKKSLKENYKYKLPEIYNWEFITKKYIDTFEKLFD